MADFQSFEAARTDPVSGKTVIGDGTGKRVEWHRRVAGVDTAIASISDAGAAVFATALRVSAFTAGTVVSDGSGNFSVSASGGTVTMAGDVIGASSANTVVGLTGTFGIVAMHGTGITVDSGNAFTFTGNTFAGSGLAAPTYTFRGAPAIAPATAGGALDFRSGTGPITGAFELHRGNAAAFLQADGSGGSTFVQLLDANQIYLDADTLTIRNGSSAPRATWTAAGIAFDAALTTSQITQTTDTGTGAAMRIGAQSSSDVVGGNLILDSGAGGGGNLPGDVILRTGTTMAVRLVANTPTPTIRLHGDSLQFDEALTTPVISQQQRQSDNPTHDLIIMSQAPFGGSVANRLAGNIWLIVPEPSTGGDPNKSIYCLVGGETVLDITRARVSVNAGFVFTQDAMSTISVKIGAEAAASGLDGSDIAITGQTAGAGNQDGGGVRIEGGIATGSGVAGGVHVSTGDLRGSMGVISKDATHGCVYLCTTGAPDPADLPGNVTNFVYVGNSAGNPFPAPANGFVMLSVGGCPYFMTSGGADFMIEGSGHATAGAIVEYMLVQYGGNLRKLALHAV